MIGLFGKPRFALQSHRAHRKPVVRWRSAEILEERALLAADFSAQPLDAVLGNDLAELYARSQTQAVVTPIPGGPRTSGNQVLVEVFTRDANAQSRLGSVGFSQVARYGNASSGWLPMQNLSRLANVQGVALVRPVYEPTLWRGSVEDEGDEALRADLARANFGVDGTGITIGILSDSYNALGGAAAGVASGDLPPDGVTVLMDDPTGTDEGRAMAEIVHALAPGARLLFATATFGAVSFANNILALAEAGADVIVDDVGYFLEPWFQDGIIAQAAQEVVSRGVTFVSAAGNAADASYEADFLDSRTEDPDDEGRLHAFRPQRNADDEPDTMQEVTVPLGGVAQIFLQWDSPFFSAGDDSGAFGDLALYVMGADGTTVVERSDILNIGRDGYEALVFFNDGTTDVDGEAGADETFNLAISLKAGFVSHIKYIYFGSMSINEYNTRSSTIWGHPNANDVIGVAAAEYRFTPEFLSDPAVLEDFSSLGGTPIFFGTSAYNSFPGTRLQPTVTGVDGAGTTFFGGFDNRFFGTSAAAPHVAGVAALMLHAAGGKGSLTPSQVRRELIDTSQDIVQRFSPTRFAPINIPVPNPHPDPGTSFDFYSGYGLVDANAAVSRVKRYAAIEGIKFSDDNANGVRDTGEVGIPNFVIYLDLNRDGLIGYGEPATLTDATGYYRFTDLDAGTYSVREVPTPGYELIAPLGEVIVTVELGQFPRVDLANRPRFDYGDAPAPYRTAKADNGPRHGIQPGLALGSLVDADTGGIVTGTGNFDDTTTSDDEDGVTFLSEFIPGRDAFIDVQATIGTNSPAVLQGWIDFDRDGKFDSPGERVIANALLKAGSNRLRVQVPNWATAGVTYSRFRYAYERDLAPVGPAQAGEVEDYRVIVSPAAGQSVLAQNDTYVVNPGSTGNLLNVLDNDLTLRGSLFVLLLGATSNGGTVGMSGSSLTYAPAAGFIGTETFSYTVSDGLGSTGQALVTITVGTPSATLNASDDVYTITVDTVGSPLPVLVNDLLPSGFTSQIASVGTPNRGGSVAIASDSRSLRYSPAPGFTGTETFTYTVSASNGESDTAQVTILVESGGSAGALARLRLRTTNLEGQTISSIAVGQSFYLRGFVQDLSAAQQGVFAGYTDITYPSNLLSNDGAIVYSSSFPNATSGTLTAGFVDEVGSAADPELLGSGEVLMFTIPLRAVGSGTALFAPDAPDILPRHAWVLFGASETLSNDQVDLLGTSIVITAAATNNTSTNLTALDVNRDTHISAIDALLVINRLNQSQATLSQDAGPLTPYDVNGDGHVSAIDALLVINHLNRQSALAAVAPPAAAPPKAAIPAASRDVVAAQSVLQKKSALVPSPEVGEESWDLFADEVAAARRRSA